MTSVDLFSVIYLTRSNAILRNTRIVNLHKMLLQRNNTFPVIAPPVCCLKRGALVRCQVSLSVTLFTSFLPYNTGLGQTSG